MSANMNGDVPVFGVPQMVLRITYISAEFFQFLGAILYIASQTPTTSFWAVLAFIYLLTTSILWGMVDIMGYFPEHFTYLSKNNGRCMVYLPNGIFLMQSFGFSSLISMMAGGRGVPPLGKIIATGVMGIFVAICAIICIVFHYMGHQDSVWSILGEQAPMWGVVGAAPKAAAGNLNDTSIQPGQTVQIQGLTSASADLYNGRSGKVVKYHADRQRWEVMLDGGKTLNVQRENLIVGGASNVNPPPRAQFHDVDSRPNDQWDHQQTTVDVAPGRGVPMDGRSTRVN